MSSSLHWACSRALGWGCALLPLSAPSVAAGGDPEIERGGGGGAERLREREDGREGGREREELREIEGKSGRERGKKGDERVERQRKT